MAEIDADIRDAIERYAEALRTLDADPWAALYADDVVVFDLMGM